MRKLFTLLLAVAVLALLAAPALAVTTVITVQEPSGKYTVPIAHGADVVWTVATVSGGNHYVANGREIVEVWNSDGTNPYTVTITSQADEYGRTGSITTYSLAAGEFAAFGPLPKRGWANGSGEVLISGSNAAIKFLILRIPEL